MPTNDKAALYPRTIKALERKITKLKASPKISKANKDVFLQFLVRQEASDITPQQRLSYLARLIPLLEMIGNKSIKDVSKTDMERMMAEYRQGYALASVNKIVQCVKCFWRYVYGLSSQDPAPEAVRWMERKKVVNDIRPEDLWTDEDMEKLLKVTRSLRDRAIFSVEFEAGLRPGELRSLRMRDVVFNGTLVRLYVRGKTEKKTGERCVPLVRSYNILREWVASHPRRTEPSAWLWSIDDEPIDERAIALQFERLAKAAGITKPCNLYILRHSCLTRCYKSLTGSVARTLAGHSPGSDMEEVYVHLAESDLDEAVRRMNGLPAAKEEKPPFCAKCGHILEIGTPLCPFCGLAKDQKVAYKEMKGLEIRDALEAFFRERPDLLALMDKGLDEQIRKRKGCIELPA